MFSNLFRALSLIDKGVTIMKYSDKKLFVPNDKENKKRGIDLGNYTHIRAYHACRPTDMESYFLEGIKPFNVEEARQVAATTFGISINTVMENEPKPQSHSSKCVYFSLFKKELLNESGHYLCLGSEYLIAIAARLDKGISGKYHEMLSNTGIPTIFICDIPIDLLPQYQTDAVSEHYDPLNSNFACWISESLSPEHIVAHEHPTKIFNPFQRRPYKNKQPICKWCTPSQK